MQDNTDNEKHCQNCKHWERDKIGFGQGVGECLIDSRPHLLKWPEQEICSRFEEKTVVQ